MKKDDRRRGGGGAVVEPVTEGVFINNSQLETPSRFDTPFSILISGAAASGDLSTRPEICAGQNQRSAA